MVAEGAGAAGLVEPTREAPKGQATRGRLVPEKLYQDLEAWFTNFMGTLDLVLEYFPEEGWYSLKEQYLARVTLVPLGGT